MLNNIKDFGASGNGLDDRDAIKKAIKDVINDTTKTKTGIFVPAGTYLISFDGLRLDDASDFMIVGEGTKSVIKLNIFPPSIHPGREWDVFFLKNCKRVGFQNLVLDGNFSGIVDGSEQMHGIHVENVDDLFVQNCTFRNCRGDGIKFITGNRIKVVDSNFIENHRHGFSIVGILKQAIINGCHFQSVANDRDLSACIDIECTNPNTPSDIVISDCEFNHANKSRAVSLRGIPSAGAGTNIVFSNNILRGGRIVTKEVTKVLIQGNIIEVPESYARPPVQIDVASNFVTVQGNIITNYGTSTEGAIKVGGKGEAVDEEIRGCPSYNVLISNNTCLVRHGNGIVCEPKCNNLTIKDNEIISEHTLASTFDAIKIRLKLKNFAIHNLNISNNNIQAIPTIAPVLSTNPQSANGGCFYPPQFVVDAPIPHIATENVFVKWANGIHISADSGNLSDASEERVVIAGNSIKGAKCGILFSDRVNTLVQGGFKKTPVCSNNFVADDVSEPIKGLEVLPEQSIISGSGVNRIGGTSLIGLLDPETHITGNVSDVYHLISAGQNPEITRFFIKKFGNNTKIGWVAL